MVFDLDDFSFEHDCRLELEKLKEINPDFKVTLFTIPAKTTIDMLNWATDNSHWVEIVQHGWDHHDNYECEKWTKEEASYYLHRAAPFFVVKGFKAPGWQISTETMEVLRDFDFWIADQPYNDGRRPEGLKVFKTNPDVDYHGHTWDCGCANGIHEDWDNISKRVKEGTDFKFVSEVVK
jgi:hypothetical protein